jgi:hypothetical protein
MILLWNLFFYWALSYQSGDVILQPLDCYSCNLIEAQENSIYSHMGIIIEKNKEIFVAESLGQVKLTPIKEFIERTQKGQKNLILRHKDFQIGYHISFIKRKFHEYEGMPFDSKFLWDDENLYCSEFVWKLLNDLDFSLPQPKIMLFDINAESWDRYFQNQTPRGELGISPEDFAKSEDFDVIEEL